MSKPLTATEQRLPDLDGFDAWGNERILETLLSGQKRALNAVGRALPAISKAVDAMVPRIRAGGRLLYAGAGTSIRVAVQDGSELPATFGMREEQIGYLIAGGRDAMFETLADAEDNAAQGARDGSACTAADVLIAVAASGRTPYTVAAAKAARANGCLTIAVVNNGDSPLALECDFEVLLESGPEVISGSTRMGAGTAQKMALNFISTLLHTRLGAVHDGLMVNIQAGNSKLVQRAASIVSQITGAPAERSAEAIAKSGGHVKPAVLLLSGAPDLASATRILSETSGNLRQALAALKTAS